MTGVAFLDLDMTGNESAITLFGQVIERFGRIDVPLVEPADTNTPFDANMVRADTSRRSTPSNGRTSTRAWQPRLRTATTPPPSPR